MEQVNGLQIYMKQLKDIPLLTKEEEIELAQKYQAGDKQAKEKLIVSNLRLVVMMARRYSAHTSIPFEDLMQEGNLGLIRAVEGFDASKGWKFSTYAMYWIKQAISRSILNRSRTIRIPVHMLELKNKYNKAVQELEEKLNREPTAEELAKKMSLKVSKIKEIELLIKEPVSLNATLNDEDDGTLEDLIPDSSEVTPDDEIDNQLRANAINKILDTLSEREKTIIIGRYGLNGIKPKTLIELSKELNLSTERVRQIEMAALHKMRNPQRLAALKPHL